MQPFHQEDSISDNSVKLYMINTNSRQNLDGMIRDTRLNRKFICYKKFMNFKIQ